MNDDDDYNRQLVEKQKRLKELFKEVQIPELEIFPSDPTHFRMRAEFRVWHEGDDLYYYMFDKEKKIKVRTDQLVIASVLINEMMNALMEELRPNQDLRHKLFQVDFLSTLSGEILVTLLYHRVLNDQWIAAATKLKERLSKKFKVHLVGRALKQKISIENNFVLEQLVVFKKTFIYKQVENCFTQPNALMAIKMLEWALDVTSKCDGDLLELYCGNGNFSVVLSTNFKNVMASELAAPSVEAANFNIKINNIKNLKIVRMSAEDLAEAMTFKRDYHRLKGIDLKSYQFETILVDPPRAGLDSKTLEFIKGFERILYISCNPITLKENLKVLLLTHKIERMALFDQFPNTFHIECGVWLKKI